MRGRAVRTVVGAVAGLVAAVPIGLLLGTGLPWFAVYSLVVGAVLGAARRQDTAVSLAGGVLVGVLGWLLFSLTAAPLLHGDAPTWSAVAAASAYPALVADLLHGAVTALLITLLPTRARVHGEAAPPKRVVIVGGGFGGVAAAKRFERLALRGAPIDVTLVSDSNFLLFTPMLAEAASGAVEASHISAPVRSAVAHTRFRHGRVESVDTAGRTVHIGSESLRYDHLVLAAGSVPHAFGLPGVREHAWTMKNLADAVRLRNHVLALLERADVEPDAERRRRLLTFVVAGAGFAGTEVVAELFDLVHTVSRYYPGVGPDESRFVLVHPGDRILPELPAELGEYARERLTARGIECVLGVRVVEAEADRVLLSDGEPIATRTFVWTAGNRPSPLVDLLPRPSGDVGPLVTDAALRVTGLDGVWAVGDCAHVPDPANAGKPCPPTAQHALRQGRTVADNIAAAVAGREPAEFRFRTLGVLVALGHRTAAADIRGRLFSGFAAWLLWRAVYLAKLPGIEKRIRVFLDWTLDLAFPRDIVVTSTPAPDKVDAR
ncbi:NAD(P)/FAD-dependent oxidoreductase [Umezawaea sp. NPDC059074]|uniref:NAD(P)/FAD-dependent oxidoreductase n=1 Tax=Umezawaea sp. NPDC059074 TaxID=3346716 RepID=UPI00368529F1